MTFGREYSTLILLLRIPILPSKACFSRTRFSALACEYIHPNSWDLQPADAQPKNASLGPAVWINIVYFCWFLLFPGMVRRIGHWTYRRKTRPCGLVQREDGNLWEEKKPQTHTYTEITLLPDNGTEVVVGRRICGEKRTFNLIVFPTLGGSWRAGPSKRGKKGSVKFVANQDVFLINKHCCYQSNWKSISLKKNTDGLWMTLDFSGHYPQWLAWLGRMDAGVKPYLAAKLDEEWSNCF